MLLRLFTVYVLYVMLSMIVDKMITGTMRYACCVKNKEREEVDTVWHQRRKNEVAVPFACLSTVKHDYFKPFQERYHNVNLPVPVNQCSPVTSYQLQQYIFCTVLAGPNQD